jgi:hypothetical protein
VFPGAQIDGIENTSGTEGELPPDIACLKWNWGAFSLAFFWLWGHRMYTGGLLLIVAAICSRLIENKFGGSAAAINLSFLGFCIYLGVNGHTLAWRRRKFDSLDHYFAVESAWKNVAIGAIALVFVMVALTFIALLTTGADRHVALTGVLALRDYLITDGQRMYSVLGTHVVPLG